MWRNGRRNGLKIRSREKRGMGSNPIIGTSKMPIFIGKIVGVCDFVGCERSRTKTHENTVYSASIRQLTCNGFCHGVAFLEFPERLYEMDSCSGGSWWRVRNRTAVNPGWDYAWVVWLRVLDRNTR